MGRLVLDPSTLRVFTERPGTSISVQICWSDEEQCPPTSTEVHARLTSSLDNWLDPGSFHGQVNIRFRGSGGEVGDSRLGEGKKSQRIHSPAPPARFTIGASVTGVEYIKECSGARRARTPPRMFLTKCPFASRATTTLHVT